MSWNVFFFSFFYLLSLFFLSSTRASIQSPAYTPISGQSRGEADFEEISGLFYRLFFIQGQKKPGIIFYMSDNSKEEEKKKFTPGELRQVIGS